MLGLQRRVAVGEQQELCAERGAASGKGADLPPQLQGVQGGVLRGAGTQQGEHQ